jgi:hypothetical protein
MIDKQWLPTFLLLTLLANLCQGQIEPSMQKYFNNDSIQYKVSFTSYNLVDKNSDKVSHYHIKIDMPNHLEKYLIVQDSTFWMNHLLDTSSDWATNLVLYYLSKREATFFITLYKNRTSWLPYKKQEIANWEILLHKKNSLIH